QLGDGAGERGGDLHGGLVGHDLHEPLAVLDGLAGVHQPADHIGLVDALAELRQVEGPDCSPDDSPQRHKGHKEEGHNEPDLLSPCALCVFVVKFFRYAASVASSRIATSTLGNCGTSFHSYTWFSPMPGTCAPRSTRGRTSRS